jgi:hypothetical protein
VKEGLKSLYHFFGEIPKNYPLDGASEGTSQDYSVQQAVFLARNGTAGDATALDFGAFDPVLTIAVAVDTNMTALKSAIELIAPGSPSWGVVQKSAFSYDINKVTGDALTIGDNS